METFIPEAATLRSSEPMTCERDLRAYVPMGAVSVRDDVNFE